MSDPERVGLILDAIEQLARTCDCGITAYIESFVAEARVKVARIVEAESECDPAA